MATLTRWDPYRALSRLLQDEMSQVLDDRFTLRPGESVGWTPAANIYEDAEMLEIAFELAGVEPKDVDVRFENGTLTVKGERRLSDPQRIENYHRTEIAEGTFTRSFSVPGSFDGEKIKAESKNGVLKVTVPKKPEAKPRTIQVKVT
jgi:HSP20 family protein